MGKHAPTLAVLLVALLGCGESGPAMGTVSGRVTFEGEPVPVGTVRFWPQSGRPATGDLDEQGRFELTTFESGDGALVGSHTVTIDAHVVEGAAPKMDSLEQEMEVFSDPSTPRVRAQRIRWLVPERYSTPKGSQLTATVEPGENQIDFPLMREKQ